MYEFFLIWKLMLYLSLLTGNTRISQAILGAHEGGIFSLCVMNDGQILSGGGKDKKVILWTADYQQSEVTQVRLSTMHSIHFSI